MKGSSIFFVATMLILSSCGSKQETTENTNSDTYEIANAEPTSPEELITQGQSLVEGSDCQTCHHKTNRIIGPSYTEVALKYDFTQASIEMLGKKIVEGGNGNWGDVAMSPHTNLTKAEAEKMAHYVLSFDEEKLH